MKTVFAGGMTISRDILKLLCEAGEIPQHVFGYPPELKHRSNYRLLDDLSAQYGFPLTNLKNINDPRVAEVLQNVRPDWFMVFGWSQLVSKELLRIPRYGTLGFHMTKLPEGRGRAPVAWTLIKGKTEGGVSLIWLEPEADNGPIAVQRTYPLSIFDDAGTVVDRVNSIACRIIHDVLPDLRTGTLPRRPQDESRATHWDKRKPEDGEIDWRLSVRELYNFIRGVTHPFPGAFSYLGQKKMKIWGAGMIECDVPGAAAGTIIGPYCAHGPDRHAGLGVAAIGGLLIVTGLETEEGRKIEGDVMVRCAEEWKGRTFRNAR